MQSAAERMRPFWTILAVTVLLDRITKVFADRALLGQALHVIGDTVQLRLVHNQGAAFGLELGAWQRWIFLAIAIAAIGWLWSASRHASVTDTLRQYAVGFVAGGAAGNAIDRMLSSRGVIDFIDVGIGTLRWPTFNVADIAVTCGAIALAISLWREDARQAAAVSSV